MFADAMMIAIHGPAYDQPQPAPVAPPSIQARTISDRWCSCCKWEPAVSSGLCLGCHAEIASDLAAIEIENAKRILAIS